MEFLDSLKNAWDEPPAETPAQDESPSPNLNALIRTVRAHQQGQATGARVLREVQEMTARLDLAIHDHDVLYGVAEVPEEIQVLADRSREALDQFSRGLELLRQALEEGGDPEPGLEVCKGAAATLEEQHLGFAAIQKRESMARCLMCSHLNEPKARQCTRCGAVLPEQMERSAAARESATSDLVMVPPEYMELYNACDSVAAGNIGIEEWRRSLDPLWQGFHQTREQVSAHLAQHEKDLQGAPELKPVAEALLEGLGRAESALEDMARFGEDGDVEHLNQGWIALLKGTRKVQESGAIFLSTLQSLQVAAAEAAEAAAQAQAAEPSK